MAELPNIKIDSSMIDEFSTPVSSQENHQKYLYVNNNGEIVYKTITDIIDDINKDGGLIGVNNKVVIRDWQPDYEYRNEETVTYNNGIWKCVVESSQRSEFNPDDWKMLAGYSKNSEFFYDPTNPIKVVTLSEPVPSKGSFIVNVNNLLLQSNNYELLGDNQTISFLNPIEKDTQIEVITFGNMIFPTALNNIITEEFTVISEEGESDFFVDYPMYKKEFIMVMVDDRVLQDSEYELNSVSDAIRLNEPATVGQKVQIKYLHNFELKVSATYSPHLEHVDDHYVLTWENDQGLPNPDPIELHDGVTFTPSVSETDYGYILSWSNNGNLENPSDIEVDNGATFTPIVSKEGNTTTIAWENDQGLDNPSPVHIVDGVIGHTYTPHVTKSDAGFELSWTNDGDLQNPETVTVNGFLARGDWSELETYTTGCLVTHEDDNYWYGYVAANNVVAGTELTDTNYWKLVFKTAKQSIAATIVDWEE